MSELVRDLIKREMGNIEDNLYRFRIQQRAMPQDLQNSWVTGNGETIAHVIASLEARMTELEKALEEM